MMRTTVSIVSALIIAFSTYQPRLNAAGSKWVSGFYVGWMSSSYPPIAIDFGSLTHVMVFSVLPKPDGTLDTTLFIDSVNGPKVAQNVAQLAHQAGKKAILTVGGAGTQAAFQGATSSLYMSTFVHNLATTVISWGFDGVDIDWEPLASLDYSAVLALIGNLRAAIPGAIVTADVGWLNANFPLSGTDAQFYVQLANAVDQMNMMTYGMADNWGGWVSWHSSALAGEGGNHPSSVSSSAGMYMNAGVPAAKLGMGIGFYGSCWNSPTTAPLQSLTTSHVVTADNTMSFVNIMSQYYSAGNYRFDSVASTPYLSFTTPTGPSGCTFVSYEDEASVMSKGQYAQQMGLGGTIIWQLSEGYDPSAADPNSLLHAVGRAFLSTTSVTVAPYAGSPQRTPEGNPFPSALQAQVKDGALNPVSGVLVNFSAPSSGASATFAGSISATAVTDANGVATAPVPVANTRNGTFAVTASVSAAATLASFSLTNTYVSPLRVSSTSGTPQAAFVNKSFSQPLVAVVVDAYGNAVPGVSVTFQAPVSGASATFGGALSGTVTTNSSGVAKSSIPVANGLVGTYAVTATASGVTSAATFSLTNKSRKGR